MTKKLICEVFGTFCLVFAGTGAIVVNEITSGAVTHVGISLTFGLIVMAMIYSIGEVSGAHINPAVTLAFAIARRFPLRQVVPYICAQLAGAISASIVVRFLFPGNSTLGRTMPSGSVSQSFILEIFLSLILMFVILMVSTGAKKQSIIAGIAVGSIVALEALLAGPISGASMNPARSLAPALVSMQFQYSWIYLIAPIIGMALAVPIAQTLISKNPPLQYRTEL
jgi:aquaporin NIP